MKLGILAIATGALLFAAPSAHAASLLNCGTGPFDIHNCPAGPQGPAGVDGKDGADSTVPGPKGDTGVAGKDGKDGVSIKGDPGAAGRDGIDGRNGRDFDMDKALALSSALSMPVWLGDNESFRVSGGVGFSDDETALGATAVFRLDPVDKNLAGFVGGAVSSDGDGWAGRAGLSYGF